MTFTESVQTCLTKYALFIGRATRSEFWWFYLFNIVLIICASAFSDVLANFISLALLIPNIAVGVRRLHDIGKSGWWLLVAFTGIGIFLLLYWYCQPSQVDTTNIIDNQLCELKPLL